MINHLSEELIDTAKMITAEMVNELKIAGLFVAGNDGLSYSSDRVTIDIQRIATKSLPANNRQEFVDKYSRNLTILLESMKNGSLETPATDNFLEKRPQPSGLPQPRFVNAYSQDNLNLYWGLGSKTGFAFLNAKNLAGISTNRDNLEQKYQNDLIKKRQFTFTVIKLPGKRGLIISGEGIVELCANPRTLVTICRKIGLTCSRVFFQALSQVIVWLNDASSNTCLSWSTVEAFLKNFTSPTEIDVAIARNHLGTEMKISRKEPLFLKIAIKHASPNKKLVDIIKPREIID
ncbi:MAG: hypothetical protein ACFFD4_32440 [Candidatus Odinarchaeota archaeon]